MWFGKMEILSIILPSILIRMLLVMLLCMSSPQLCVDKLTLKDINLVETSPIKTSPTLFHWCWIFIFASMKDGIKGISGIARYWMIWGKDIIWFISGMYLISSPLTIFKYLSKKDLLVIQLTKSFVVLKGVDMYLVHVYASFAKMICK